MKSSAPSGFFSFRGPFTHPAQILAGIAVLLTMLPCLDAAAVFTRQYDTDFDNRFFAFSEGTAEPVTDNLFNDRFIPFATGTPESVVAGDPPFDNAFGAFDTSLMGVLGRDGLEVRFDGADYTTDPTLTQGVVAQTQTNLIPDAERYLISTRLRFDSIERRNSEPATLTPGFYLDFDLGNALSGGFTIEFAKDFSGRNSIYLFNSLNNVTRRIGTFETGDSPLWITSVINATNQRMALQINGETVWRGNIDMNPAISYTPNVLASLVEVVNIQEASQTSRVAMMNFKSYYNPEPGMAMVGLGALGLLAKRRRVAQG